MNKKILILFYFCFLTNIKAQTQRFIYEYKFVPDSTKIDSTITENTRLEIFKDHSEFLSDVTAKRDSAILKSAERNFGEVGTDLPAGLFKNKVWKSKDKLYVTESIGIENFNVVNDIKLEWKLTNETKIIQNYNCQKATLNYGNRNWEAWFTTDILIQDGPYIFRNLPGLIVQIQDKNNLHSFLLIANYKSNSTKTNIPAGTASKRFKSYDVTREQFNKKWNDFKKYPIGGSEQFMLMNPDISDIRHYDENGKEQNMSDVRAKERLQAKKIINERNNFIDLQLYE